MATTSNQFNSLLSIPLSSTMDFTILADYCEQFAEAQAEFDFPVLRPRFASASSPA